MSQNRCPGTLLSGWVYMPLSPLPEPKGIVLFANDLQAKFQIYLSFKPIRSLSKYSNRYTNNCQVFCNLKRQYIDASLKT